MEQSKNSQLAKKFIKAIRTIAEKENNLNNFQLYLSIHFDKWMEKFASNPEGLTAELESFANMEI